MGLEDCPGLVGGNSKLCTSVIFRKVEFFNLLHAISVEVRDKERLMVKSIKAIS